MHHAQCTCIHIFSGGGINKNCSHRDRQTEREWEKEWENTGKKCSVNTANISISYFRHHNFVCAIAILAKHVCISSSTSTKWLILKNLWHIIFHYCFNQHVEKKVRIHAEIFIVLPMKVMVVACSVVKKYSVQNFNLIMILHHNIRLICITLTESKPLTDEYRKTTRLESSSWNSIHFSLIEQTFI